MSHRDSMLNVAQELWTASDEGEDINERVQAWIMAASVMYSFAMVCMDTGDTPGAKTYAFLSEIAGHRANLVGIQTPKIQLVSSIGQALQTTH